MGLAGHALIMIVGVIPGIIAGVTLRDKLYEILGELPTRLADWHHRTFKIGPFDAMIRRVKDLYIIWPISDEAKTWVQKNAGHYPKMYGGYAVPKKHFQPILATMTHGPRFLIEWRVTNGFPRFMNSKNI